MGPPSREVSSKVVYTLCPPPPGSGTPDVAGPGSAARARARLRTGAQVRAAAGAEVHQDQSGNDVAGRGEHRPAGNGVAQFPVGDGTHMPEPRRGRVRLDGGLVGVLASR